MSGEQMPSSGQFTNIICQKNLKRRESYKRNDEHDVYANLNKDVQHFVNTIKDSSLDSSNNEILYRSGQSPYKYSGIIRDMSPHRHGSMFNHRRPILKLAPFVSRIQSNANQKQLRMVKSSTGFGDKESSLILQKSKQIIQGKFNRYH